MWAACGLLSDGAVLGGDGDIDDTSVICLAALEGEGEDAMDEDDELAIGAEAAEANWRNRL